jgi:hypothetical protein
LPFHRFAENSPCGSSSPLLWPLPKWALPFPGGTICRRRMSFMTPGSESAQAESRATGLWITWISWISRRRLAAIAGWPSCRR